LLKVPLGQNNFFLESHPKLAPVDTNTSGIYICGCAQYPKDSADSIAQASATAARATTILSKDKLKGEANIAIVDTDRCSGCETCIMICPYNAIDKLDGKARVNEALCKGCGSCAGICRNGAIQQKGFFDDQIISMIDAILEEDV
jgi:heterodisulfide reductase subunit A2